MSVRAARVLWWPLRSCVPLTPTRARVYRCQLGFYVLSEDGTEAFAQKPVPSQRVRFVPADKLGAAPPNTVSTAKAEFTRLSSAKVRSRAKPCAVCPACLPHAHMQHHCDTTACVPVLTGHGDVEEPAQHDEPGDADRASAVRALGGDASRGHQVNACLS